MGRGRGNWRSRIVAAAACLAPLAGKAAPLPPGTRVLPTKNSNRFRSAGSTGQSGKDGLPVGRACHGGGKRRSQRVLGLLGRTARKGPSIGLPARGAHVESGAGGDYSGVRVCPVWRASIPGVETLNRCRFGCSRLIVNFVGARRTGQCTLEWCASPSVRIACYFFARQRRRAAIGSRCPCVDTQSVG